MAGTWYKQTARSPALSSVPPRPGIFILPASHGSPWAALTSATYLYTPRQPWESVGSLHLHLSYVSLYSLWGRRAIREPNHPRQNSSLAECHLCERAFNVERVTWSTAKGEIRNHRTHRWALRPVSTLKAHRESSPHTCSSERKILAGLVGSLRSATGSQTAADQGKSRS